MLSANRFTADTITVVFLDHTPSTFRVGSIDPAQLELNVLGLAKVVRALEAPAVLSSLLASGAPFADSLFEKLYWTLDEHDAIERTAFDAFGSGDFRSALHNAARKKIILCGLWTETVVLQTAMTAIARGFDVGIVSDCSGGATLEAHEAAIQRMIQAGAAPMTWLSLATELCSDTASDRYRSLHPILLEHGALALPPQARVWPKPPQAS